MMRCARVEQCFSAALKRYALVLRFARKKQIPLREGCFDLFLDAGFVFWEMALSLFVE